MDVNLDGSFLCAREVGKHMIEQKVKGGSIILVGSMCGEVCVRPQKQAAYNAVRSSTFFEILCWKVMLGGGLILSQSKAAIIMLAKSLATEYVSLSFSSP